MRSLANIFWLGTKELRSFLHDFVLLGLVIYAFSLAVIMRRHGAIRRNCTTRRSPSSTRTIPSCRAASRTRFCRPISAAAARSPTRDIVPLMNAGKFTFVIDIPPNFERDVLGGRQPGTADRCRRHRDGAGRPRLRLRPADHHYRDRAISVAREEVPAVAGQPAVRIAFNPNVTTAWFTSVMGIINNVTMLAIILAGAAIVREREHGTMDHLLVMPLTPFEIAMSKVWANGLVITVAVGLSLYVRRAHDARHSDRRLDPACSWSAS